MFSNDKKKCLFIRRIKWKKWVLSARAMMARIMGWCGYINVNGALQQKGTEKKKNSAYCCFDVLQITQTTAITLFLSVFYAIAQRGIPSVYTLNWKWRRRRRDCRRALYASIWSSIVFWSFPFVIEITKKWRQMHTN